MLLNSKDLAVMRETQSAAMHDTGRVLRYTAGARDEYGAQSEATYDPQTPFSCGVEMKPGFERYGAQMVTVNYDAILRIPLNTQIAENDKFEILYLYGEPVTELVYEVAAPVQRGSSASRVLLRKVVK